MFFRLGDDRGLCYEAFGALMIAGGVNHTLDIDQCVEASYMRWW